MQRRTDTHKHKLKHTHTHTRTKMHAKLMAEKNAGLEMGDDDANNELVYCVYE